MRGKITHRDRARQIKDFSKLRYGKITPTDIDGFIEYKNKAYVIFEIKLSGKDLPRGQRIALERMADDLAKVKQNTICFVAEHNAEVSKDIQAHNAIVSEYRWESKWIKSSKRTTLKQAIDLFLSKI
jgi:hypothetical protein